MIFISRFWLLCRLTIPGYLLANHLPILIDGVAGDTKQLGQDRSRLADTKRALVLQIGNDGSALLRIDAPILIR